EQLWLIYVSAGCISLGEAIYAPTRMAFIPSLVKQDRLIYVNAIEQIMLGVVLIIGSSIGGIISFVFGLSIAFVFDAISFILSAMILNQISFSNQLLSKVKTVKQMNISIYKVILSSSALLVLVFIEFTMPLANGIDNVLMSIYALDVFKMGDIGVGLIYGCLGLGF